MDLDDILNDALEEVTRDEDIKSTATTTSLSSAAASTAQKQDANATLAASQEPQGEEADIAKMLQMFSGGGDFEKILDEAFKDLDLNDLMSKLGVNSATTGTADTPGSNDEMENLMKLLGSPGDGTSGGSTDGEMEKLMKLLGGGGGQGGDPKVLEQLANKLESSMGGDQMNQMLENMMKSVMSKDIMYEPIKAITDEYPKFLQQKGIPPADRSRFESQYQAYKALRKTFEDEPENSEKIMQIMQDLERFGQPPEEISKLLGAQGAAAGGGMPNPNACPTQ